MGEAAEEALADGGVAWAWEWAWAWVWEVEECPWEEEVVGEVASRTSEWVTSGATSAEDAEGA